MNKRDAYAYSLAIPPKYRAGITFDEFVNKVKFFVFSDDDFRQISAEDLSFTTVNDENGIVTQKVGVCGDYVCMIDIKQSTGKIEFFASSTKMPLFFENKDDLLHYFTMLFDDRARVTSVAKEQYESSLEKQRVLDVMVSRVREI